MNQSKQVITIELIKSIFSKTDDVHVNILEKERSKNWEALLVTIKKTATNEDMAFICVSIDTIKKIQKINPSYKFYAITNSTYSVKDDKTVQTETTIHYRKN
jgi:hypothetical protein